MAKLQYKYYVLSLLTVIGVFNYLDRGVLAMAMEPMKAEFGVSDGELGLMSGFAFALFYAVAGVPIARWADRGNRNHVITLTTSIWSAMLVMCSLVTSFSQLLVARVGVAVGEAGCVPPAQSLISEYFGRAERPQAMAIYWLCAPIATIVSYAGGGWLIDELGWRNTFLVIGLPGVFLAVLVKFTLREPRCIKGMQLVEKQPSFKEVIKILWRGRAFRNILVVFCASMFFEMGIAIWIPAFLIRSHGMNISEIGYWMGLGFGVSGLIFTYLGGHLAAGYASNREAFQMKWIAFANILSTFILIICFLSDSKITVLIMATIVMGVLTPLTIAPIFSIIQSLVEERVRAVALALILMVSHLIGMGLGPVVIGFISDFIFPYFESESLRYALLIFSPGFLWSAFHAWQASITIEDDIKNIEEKANQLQIKDGENGSKISLSSSPEKVFQ